MDRREAAEIAEKVARFLSPSGDRRVEISSFQSDTLAAGGEPLDVQLGVSISRQILSVRTAVPWLPKVGAGISHSSKDGWRVAIRAWTSEDLAKVRDSVPAIRSIRDSELDVRVTGTIRIPMTVDSTVSSFQARSRPLRPGYSVAHRGQTAGTIGAFVIRHGDSNPRLLSNAHVLTAGFSTTDDDSILQPGPSDGGQKSADVIGSLAGFGLLQSDGNTVDAAVASIDDQYVPTEHSLPKIGRMTGSWGASPSDFESLTADAMGVRKVGRTTDLTSGYITAIIDALPVDYGFGAIRRFNRVIEVQGTGSTPMFSQGGDSGALVVDNEAKAVGLLFAGDSEATYLNPIEFVLSALNVQLLL